MNRLPIWITIPMLLELAAGQDPQAPQPPDGVRLVYELPVDALQRASRANPDIDLEEVLAHSVDVLTERLAGIASVQRRDASRVTVDVAEATADRLQRVRRLCERRGTLRMQIVADPQDDARREHEHTLAAERARLTAWLAEGGLKRVLEDPAHLAEYNNASATERIVWVPHRIRRNGERWHHSLTQQPHFAAAVVPLYEEQHYNHGNVPAARLADDDACLLELVALDLSRGGFWNEHFDADKVAEAKGFNNEPALYYEVVPGQRKRYSDWSDQNIGRMCAMLVDGELLSAPIFRSRVPGRGIIEGLADADRIRELATALRTGPLLLAPTLIDQQPLAKER